MHSRRERKRSLLRIINKYPEGLLYRSKSEERREQARWNPILFRLNSNIDLEFIQSTPSIDWNHESILSNSNISVEYRLNYLKRMDVYEVIYLIESHTCIITELPILQYLIQILDWNNSLIRIASESFKIDVEAVKFLINSNYRDYIRWSNCEYSHVNCIIELMLHSCIHPAVINKIIYNNISPVEVEFFKRLYRLVVELDRMIDPEFCWLLMYSEQPSSVNQMSEILSEYSLSDSCKNLLVTHSRSYEYSKLIMTRLPYLYRTKRSFIGDQLAVELLNDRRMKHHYSEVLCNLTVSSHIKLDFVEGRIGRQLCNHCRDKYISRIYSEDSEFNRLIISKNPFHPLQDMVRNDELNDAKIKWILYDTIIIGNFKTLDIISRFPIRRCSIEYEGKVSERFFKLVMNSWVLECIDWRKLSLRAPYKYIVKYPDLKWNIEMACSRS
jgi:hypothetical protein